MSEPDRFDAQAGKVIDDVIDCMNGKMSHAECRADGIDHVAAALRAEHAEARAIALDEAHSIAYEANAEDIADQIEQLGALIPPAAAHAAETGKVPDEALRLLSLVARKWTEAMTEIDASPLVVSIKEVARVAPPEGEGKT